MRSPLSRRYEALVTPQVSRPVSCETTEEMGGERRGVEKEGRPPWIMGVDISGALRSARFFLVWDSFPTPAGEDTAEMCFVLSRNERGSDPDLIRSAYSINGPI